MSLESLFEPVIVLTFGKNSGFPAMLRPPMFHNGMYGQPLNPYYPQPQPCGRVYNFAGDRQEDLANNDTTNDRNFQNYADHANNPYAQFDPNFGTSAPFYAGGSKVWLRGRDFPGWMSSFNVTTQVVGFDDLVSEILSLTDTLEPVPANNDAGQEEELDSAKAAFTADALKPKVEEMVKQLATQGHAGFIVPELGFGVTAQVVDWIFYDSSKYNVIYKTHDLIVTRPVPVRLMDLMPTAYGQQTFALTHMHLFPAMAAMLMLLDPVKHAELKAGDVSIEFNGVTAQFTKVPDEETVTE